MLVVGQTVRHCVPTDSVRYHETKNRLKSRQAYTDTATQFDAQRRGRTMVNEKEEKEKEEEIDEEEKRSKAEDRTH